MPHEHYCFDDISLVGWLDDSASPTGDIHSFVDALEDIVFSEEQLLAPSTLESVPIGKGLHFYDLYCFDFSGGDMQHGVDRDAHSRLLIARGRFTDIEVTPTLVASLGDEGGENPYTSDESGTAAIILSPNRTDQHFAMLTIRSGSLFVGAYTLRTTAGSTRPVFVIRSKDDLPKYVRWVMSEGAVCEQDFFFLWNRAFPALQKSDNLSFSRLSGNYRLLCPQVIRHLSFLNDDFMSIFELHKNNVFELTRIAKSQFGIDFSNESPKTRDSKSKMKQRSANFSGTEVTCEMHTKLSSMINRIHFHPPIEKLGKGRVLIGIFVDHLDT